MSQCTNEPMGQKVLSMGHWGIGALGNWLIAMFFPLDIRSDLPYNIDILKCINMMGSGGNG
jgi:hypothetical protein